jgi:hypothetical protein
VPLQKTFFSLVMLSLAAAAAAADRVEMVRPFN